jgi:hypothetical protein
MGCLAGICYDPGTAASAATTSLLAMTAIDTTNLRNTFTAPANGVVLVRIRTSLQGATTFPTVLLGVLDGSTVKGRQPGIGALPGTALATTNVTQEALFCVTGLTGGTSYTYDAAYAVQVVLASTAIKYGGPNNTSANDAYGGFVFEIWDTPNLISAICYDPSSAVTNKACTAAAAMTAFDTTNLRITFTAPASGKVYWRIRCPIHGATTFGQVLLGILESSTVKARVPAMGGNKTTAVATTQMTLEGSGVISGLTGGSSYTYDAAWGVETGVTSCNFKYGGPNNNSGNNAWGGFVFEIWAA